MHCGWRCPAAGDIFAVGIVAVAIVFEVLVDGDAAEHRVIQVAVGRHLNAVGIGGVAQGLRQLQWSHPILGTVGIDLRQERLLLGIDTGGHDLLCHGERGHRRRLEENRHHEGGEQCRDE